jgi:lipoate---protein ligase
LIWNRIGPEVLSGPVAVARAVGLLDRLGSGTPIASWSRVSPAALVLGRSARQPLLNDEALSARGITVVHRSSGGGPVLWDENLLSLDVAVPPGDPRAGRDITEAYRWLGEVVADALGRLGITARVVSLAEARADAARDDPVAVQARRACFGGLSPYEVVGPDDRKIVGLSQVRRQAGTLFQCGIALRFDAELLATLIEPVPDEAAVLASALRASAAGLDEYGARVDVGTLIGTAEAALADQLGVELSALTIG